MNGTVFVKNYGAPELDLKEVLRYAGADKNDKATEETAKECFNEANALLKYNICFIETAVTVNKDTVFFGDTVFKSYDLAKNLSGAQKAVIFAATVGTGIDRLIAKYNAVSPQKALIMNALGNERVESLCDIFNAEIKENAEKEGMFTSPRFSAGYGDFSISAQKDIVKLLDCGRKIGVTLNDSLLMSPSKSVTAVIGIKSFKCEDKKSCDGCNNKNCTFRR